MFYDIITLDPTVYIKKSKKATDFSETTEFIGILQTKLNEWNIKYSCHNKAATAHKLKYDQFENSFLKQAHLVVYIVSLFSEVGFRDTIKKLINSCTDKEKLKRVIVISLDKSHFVELEDSVIDLVHFGNYTWKSEEDKQWNILEGELVSKLQTIVNNNVTTISKVNAATLPIAIPSHKSSFKIKSFFNSLPAKFKDKTTRDQYNESVPNITISNSHNEEFSDNVKTDKPIGLRHREDHTKLSLTSLFRKRSRKARDSGLSGTSSASNDSRNSKGQFPDMVFDLSNEPSPLCERSAVLRTSSLEKTKTYRAKIHMFKDKASKYFNSASCLNSPEHKRKKNADDSFFNEGQFSGQQIVGFSEILVKDVHLPINGVSLMSHRELPVAVSVTELNSSPSGILKYYSWNGDLNVKQDLMLEQLTCNDLEITATSLPPSNEIELTDEEIFDDIEIENQITESITMNFVEEEIVPATSVDTKEEINTDVIDGDYFQVQYAPNNDISPRKTGKHTVTFKLDGLDSLENIMESIEKSCNELKLNSRSSRDSNSQLKTFKSPNRKEASDEVTKSKSIVVRAMNARSNRLQEETKQLPESETTPVDTKSDSKTHSFLYRTAQAMIRNPFIVLGVFTATAYCAPLWHSYMPRDVHIGHFLYDIILDNHIIQSLPSNVVSAVTKVTSVTATTMSRAFHSIY